MSLPVFDDHVLFEWHRDAWAAFARSLEQGQVPHAWLMTGPRGTGVQEFADVCAAAMLCEQPRPDRRACGVCVSCRLLAAHTHPDLKRVRPAWLARLEAVEAVEDDVDSDGDEAGLDKSAKSAGRAITIDMTRAVAQFIGLAPHRGGRRVVLLYPAEAMRHEAANALLKTLEEPTAGAVFILVAQAPDALLPTIASRCRRWVLPAPSSRQALHWLESHSRAKSSDETSARLAAIGNAPLDLLDLGGVRYWDVHDPFIDALADAASLDPLATARSLDTEIKRTEKARQQGERAAVDLRTVVIWLQRWIEDVISLRLSGTHRYYPRRSSALGALADGDLDRLFAYATFLHTAARDCGHAVNSLLFLEDCLMRYAEAVAPRA